MDIPINFVFEPVPLSLDPASTPRSSLAQHISPGPPNSRDGSADRTDVLRWLNSSNPWPDNEPSGTAQHLCCPAAVSECKLMLSKNAKPCLGEALLGKGQLLTHHLHPPDHSLCRQSMSSSEALLRMSNLITGHLCALWAVSNWKICYSMLNDQQSVQWADALLLSPLSSHKAWSSSSQIAAAAVLL